ncbi:hypothetical protein L9F63_022743, partial [Diploptera punctata]
CRTLKTSIMFSVFYVSCCSYTVSVGVVDKLALYCGGVRDPIDGDPQAAQFLLSGIELLTTLAA